MAAKANEGDGDSEDGVGEVVPCWLIESEGDGDSEDGVVKVAESEGDGDSEDGVVKANESDGDGDSEDGVVKLAERKLYEAVWTEVNFGVVVAGQSNS